MDRAAGGGHTLPMAQSFPQDYVALNADRIRLLVEDLQAWPGPRLASHRSASQPFHKLAFLADLGLEAGYPGLGPAVEKILSGFGPESLPGLPMEISVAHGGSGETRPAWAICDAPTTLYALKLLGVEDPRIEAGTGYLAGLDCGQGYGCHLSPVMGGWRGPGKASDPCPYASLVMLKLLLQYGSTYRERVHSCAECLLGLWADSRTRHPYIFYMGEDFRKLKLPFIWYDLLHVLEALSQVEECRRDPRLLEMLAVVKAKEGPEGYLPEAVYQPFKGWDFGQKKKASEWMGFCIQRIETRLAGPA